MRKLSTKFNPTSLKREYSKLDKATALKALGESYSNHRVRIQIPQYCKDGDDQIEGYYISAAVSGQDSGVNPAQPTTNYPLNGFSGIMYSNGYFTKEDLNVIAEGGIEIFKQEVIGAPFLSRHQMTTDTSLLTKREKSIVRAVDWFSLFIKKALAKWIGRNNITDTLLEILRFITQALINYAINVKKICGKGTKMIKLAQNPDFLDHIDVRVQFDSLTPANYIDVTIYI